MRRSRGATEAAGRAGRGGAARLATLGRAGAGQAAKTKEDGIQHTRGGAALRPARQPGDPGAQSSERRAPHGGQEVGPQVRELHVAARGAVDVQ